MRLLSKLLFKLITLCAMVVLVGVGLKYGLSYMSPETDPKALEDVQFSSDESGLMSTVLTSALRMFSGSATREELAQELSEKLYSDRSSGGDMSELGIVMVNPKGNSTDTDTTPGIAQTTPGAETPPSSALQSRVNGSSTAEAPESELMARFTQTWEHLKPFRLQLALVPMVFFGLFAIHRIRRRSQKEVYVPLGFPINDPAEAGPFDPKHAVDKLQAEDFELLVALIYQRQGYRISMPAGLGSGRGGDFTMMRKSERILVQCKKLNSDHSLDVERVRELHDAANTAGATKAMYVASCNFSWDARNFGKMKGMTLINARTLDELISAAAESHTENLLDVPQWVSKFMVKVELTTPSCPACEAKMDSIQVNGSSVWVCSQRPECRGRRSARQYVTARSKPLPELAK